MMRTLPALALSATVLAWSPQAVARTLAGPPPEMRQIERGVWSGERWWLAYRDPQLDALIEEGLSHAPRLKVVQARARRAAALADATGAARWPALIARGAAADLHADDGALGRALSATGATSGLATAGVELGYELDLRGTVRHAASAARSDARAARADAAMAALVLSTAVAQTYGDLGALQDLREVSLDELRVRRETLAATRRRFDAGLAPLGDVSLADAATARAAADLAATDEAIARARIELAVLIGVDPARMASLERPGARAVQGPDAAVDAPFDQSVRAPPAVAARLRLEAADQRIALARAEYLPRIRLLALAGLATGGGVLGAGDGVNAVGSVLGLPLFDGGRRRAGLAAARAEREAALASYDEAVRRATGDAAAVLASQRAVTAQLQHRRAALASSAAAWESARRRLDAGDADYPTVLLAEDRMLAERRAVLALEARRYRLEIDLVLALGGGWREAG